MAIVVPGPGASHAFQIPGRFIPFRFPLLILLHFRVVRFCVKRMDFHDQRFRRRRRCRRLRYRRRLSRRRRRYLRFCDVGALSRMTFLHSRHRVAIEGTL